MSSKRAIFFLAAVWCFQPIEAQESAAIAIPTSTLQKTLMQAAVTNCDRMATLHTTSMQEALTELYQRRNYSPLWLDDDQGLSISRFSSLQNELRQLGDDGLWLADYSDALDATQSTDVCQEVRLSSYYLMALEHLSRGRLPPLLHDPQWLAVTPTADINADLVTLALVNDAHIADAFTLARPSLKLYTELRSSYALMAKPAPAQTDIPAGATIRPNAMDDRLPQVFERLVSAGYLPSDSRLPQVYDSSLEIALRHFQIDNGLESDGVIGAKTLAAMNITPQQRLLKIRINLERLRWIAAQREDYLLLVNIAGGRVRLLRGEETIWESRVQTGRPARPTPSLVSSINRITLNPSWTIPPTIMRQDVLPQIRNNPDYLREKNLQVIDFQGKLLDPAQQNWSKPTGIMLRQPPGPTNPLGQVVFRLDNPFSIYLHDTPSQNLFNQSSRSVSSGCVRVEDAQVLAGILMESTSAEKRALLLNVQDSEKTMEIALPGGPQLIISYWTAEAGEDGRATLMQDPYALDQPLMNAFTRIEQELRGH